MKPLAGLAVVLLAVAGCSSPPERPPAAEPAAAPTQTQPPTGRVISVGAQAEGIAVDPVSHAVAVGVRSPEALVILDGNTGSVLHKVALPGQLRHLQLQAPGGPVLVPNEGSGELIKVSLPGGEVVSKVSTGTFPHDATAAANGTVFVSNEHGHSVVAVRDDKIAHTFGNPVQPGGIAAVGNLVGMVDVRSATLTEYDADKLTEVATVPAGDGPTHLIADKAGRLVAVDTRGNAVLFFGLTPRLRQLSKVTLPGNPYGSAYDPTTNRMWVTLTALNEVVALDLSSDPPKTVARFPTVRQPNTVAVDSGTGRVFVTGTTDGVVELIDP